MGVGFGATPAGSRPPPHRPDRADSGPRRPQTRSAVVGSVAVCQRTSGTTAQRRDYDGLAPRSGHERDHIIPLCLDGADTPDNVRYQPLAEAHEKNRRERAACEAYCAGAHDAG